MPSRHGSVALILGLMLGGISSYLAYLLYKSSKDDDEEDYENVENLHGRKGVLEVRIPKDMVRVIIGRNGKNIKELQEASKTKISFKNDKEESSQICVIRGAPDNCKLAENLLYEFIANQPKLETEIITVPHATIGRIIGRCGERLQDIRTITGATIKIIDNNEDFSTTTTPSSSQDLQTKRIMIKGTSDQVQLAKEAIETIVTDAQQMDASIEAALSKREPRTPLSSAAKFSSVDGGSPSGTTASDGKSRCANERLSPVANNPDSQFDVYVSAMLDPSRFWLQIVGPKATKLDQLVEEMTDYYGKEEHRNEHALDDVDQGKIVAAMFSCDNKWYRAEILEVKSDEKAAELYYVDYGDTETIPLKDLFELRTDFLQLPFQAIECYLARVEPNGDVWSEEAKDRFEALAHVAYWKKLSARVNGYQNREKTRAKREGSPVPGVDLYDVNNQKDINIAQELVNEGYAIYKKAESADLRSSSVSRTSTRSNESVSPTF